MPVCVKEIKGLYTQKSETIGHASQLNLKDWDLQWIKWSTEISFKAMHLGQIDAPLANGKGYFDL